jgi:hypothetical protein
LGFLRTPVRTGITLLTRLPCCSFLPDFIEQKKLGKFIKQISEAPLTFVSLSILRFMAFHGKRCSLLSHFLFIRVALLHATLRLTESSKLKKLLRVLNPSQR